MTNDTKVCEYAESYIEGVSQIYHCNKEENCPDKTYIPGILDSHNKPLPLCKREMARNLEEKVAS